MESNISTEFTLIDTLDRKRNNLCQKNICIYGDFTNNNTVYWISYNNGNGLNTCGHVYGEQRMINNILPEIRALTRHWETKTKEERICLKCSDDREFTRRCFDPKNNETLEIFLSKKKSLLEKNPFMLNYEQLNQTDQANLLIDLVYSPREASVSSLMAYNNTKYNEFLIDQISNHLININALKSKKTIYVSPLDYLDTVSYHLCIQLAKSRTPSKWTLLYLLIKLGRTGKSYIAFHNIMCCIVGIQTDRMTGTSEMGDINREILPSKYMYWIEVSYFEDHFANSASVHEFFIIQNTPFFFKNTQTFLDFDNNVKRPVSNRILYNDWVVLHNNVRAFYSLLYVKNYNAAWMTIWISEIGKRFSSENTFVAKNMAFPLQAFFQDINILTPAKKNKQNLLPFLQNATFVFNQDFPIDADQKIVNKFTIVDFFLPGIYPFLKFVERTPSPDKTRHVLTVFALEFQKMFFSYLAAQDINNDSVYLQNVRRFYDNAWFVSLSQQPKHFVYTFHATLRTLFDQLQTSFKDDFSKNELLVDFSNEQILTKVNQILQLSSERLPVQHNTFYDMISVMLGDLQTQKQIRLKLVKTVIDADHTSVTVVPARKKWLGIFAKQGQASSSVPLSIGDNIDGKQKSFLVLYYGYPNGKRPTTSSAITMSVPIEVALEFLALNDIHNVDLEDRLMFPGAPPYAPYTLDQMWRGAVEAFSRADSSGRNSLIFDKQDAVKKIVFFKVNPSNPVTVSRLRQRLQSLTPLLKYKYTLRK